MRATGLQAYVEVLKLELTGPIGERQYSTAAHRTHRNQWKDTAQYKWVKCGCGQIHKLQWTAKPRGQSGGPVVRTIHNNHT